VPDNVRTGKPDGKRNREETADSASHVNADGKGETVV